MYFEIDTFGALGNIATFTGDPDNILDIYTSDPTKIGFYLL